MAFKAELNRIILALLSLYSLPASVVAQEAPITSDGTTATNVTTLDGSNFDINGGDIAGGNLFHRFGNFSVPNGGSANFLNSPDIVNIINRVTGGKISEINGLLKANGAANLFLINPAGIVFGPNASLNIGGSFLGSTADSLLFDDGTEFSATNLQASPLLRINAPIGLNLRDNPRNIVNRSVAQNPNGETNVTGGNVGLQVNPGQTLALIGGDVLLDDGNLTAKGGRIEIGNVQGSGKVVFNSTENGLVFDYSSIDSFGNIKLENTAVVDVTAGGGGDIVITGQNIEIDNSSLNAGILSKLGSIDAQSGDIKLNASEALTIANNSFIRNNIFSEASGNAGGVDITTKNLSISNGAQVSVSTNGAGNAGDLIVRASDSVELSGEGDSPSGLFAQVNPQGTGNGGNLTIETKRLSVSDGSKVQVSTFGEGNAGDLTIRASDIDVFETPIDNFFSTGIFAEVSLARRPNSSEILAKGKGNAGNLTIETDRLRIKDGGQVSVSTFGEGNAGTLTVKASDSIEVSGIEDANAFGGSKGGFRSKSFLGSEVKEGATGRGGNVKIETGELKIANQGRISVSSLDESGTAGNLEVKADSINLDRGTIRAATSFGEGGNINLNIDDKLTMRNNSSISTQGTGDANGGNITITAPDGFVVAFPKQNNDIIATAQAGKGGQININAQRVYGFNKERIQSIEVDPQTLSNNGENDINSTSADPQLSGNINLNTEQLDPAKERTKTSENLVEPDETVAQACGTDGSGTIANSFTITGRGGMPADPTKPLNSSYLSGEKVSGGQRGSDAQEQKGGGEPISLDENKKTFSSDEVIPARGMMMNEKGQIVLTAYPTPNASDRNAPQSNYCSSSLKQEELLATNKASDRSEDVLDDRAIEEIMNLLYSQGLGQ
jgi:filamentous hemagglutinin family protein